MLESNCVTNHARSAIRDLLAKLCRPFAIALCLDLPYILDSVWRHAEYNANREFDYHVARAAGSVDFGFTLRRHVHSPAFVFLVLTLLFVAYGPTLDSLCSVLGAEHMRHGRGGLGVLVLALGFLAWYHLARYGWGRATKRFFNATPPVAKREWFRRFFVRACVEAGVLLPVGTIWLFGCYLVETSGILGTLGDHLAWASNSEICHSVPSDWPARLQFFALLIAVGIVAVDSLSRSVSRLARTRIHALVLLILGSVLWGLIAPAWASEANQTPYLHIYGVFACLLAVLTIIAPRLAHWLLGSIDQEKRALYQVELTRTELFPPAGSRADPDISGRRFWAALLTGITYNFLHFLLLPSFFALIMPSRHVLWTFALGLLVSAWLIMTGNFTSRWQVMLEQVRRWFLAGTPLAVSVAVIGLAILRLARVQYVATVLDAAPFGVIFTWIIMAYALLWWFEFSVNGSICAELLSILRPEVKREPSEAQPAGGEIVETEQVPYPADGIAAQARNVEADHRYIAVHGSGRYVALGWFKDKTKDDEPTRAFQAYDLFELFENLTPAEFKDYWHDLKRRIQLYFLSLNGAIVLALGGLFGFYYGYGDEHNTVTSVVTAAPLNEKAPLFNLATSLEAPRASEASAAISPAYIVAASGGGTRAALYTASALEGLQRLEIAQHIVLLSGVSGGGVALAYFYAHRTELLAQHTFPNEPWTRFKKRMAGPFIGDVLEGSGEWRVISREPLGQLLVESFERRLFGDEARQATFGDDSDVGLILNTTITAHPQEDSDLLRGAFAPPEHSDGSCDSLHRPYAMVGGGRLIFTNLRDPAAFPVSGSRPPDDANLHIPDVRLPYIVVRDSTVELAIAAALNANFPPVFTNARVDVISEPGDTRCPTRAYYVTDGGANENLGLVSALYALRGALAELHKAHGGNSAKAGEDSAVAIRPVHIVTIEASASTYDYAPDRGVGAATDGAKERLTGGVTQELLNEVEASFAGMTPKPIEIHHLALPLAFRSRGGFGTHWMFPESIVVTDPRRAAPLKWYWDLVPAAWFHVRPRTALDKEELFDLWAALYDPDTRFCERRWDETKERVADWICGRYPPAELAPTSTTPLPSPTLPADIQIAQWQGLVDSVKNSGTTP
jgi:hypothetical protein